MVNMLVGWDDFLEPDIQTGSEKQERRVASVCTVHCWVLKDIYSVCLWKVGWVDFISSSDQYTLLYGVFNQCAHLNGFQGRVWVPDCYGTVIARGHGRHVGDVAAAAAATPPDVYSSHWSVGARPSALALHHWWSFLVHLSIKKLTEHPSIRLNVPLSDAPNRLIELRPGFCQRWFFNPVTFVFWFAEYPQQLIDIWINQDRKMDGEWITSISTSW